MNRKKNTKRKKKNNVSKQSLYFSCLSCHSLVVCFLKQLRGKDDGETLSPFTSTCNVSPTCRFHLVDYKTQGHVFGCFCLCLRRCLIKSLRACFSTSLLRSNSLFNTVKPNRTEIDNMV